MRSWPLGTFFALNFALSWLAWWLAARMGFGTESSTIMGGLAFSGVLLGLVWAAWHLPTFYLFPHSGTFQQSFPLYALQVMAISIARVPNLVAVHWISLGVRGILSRANARAVPERLTPELTPTR